MIIAVTIAVLVAGGVYMILQRGMVRIGENYGYVHTGNGSWFPLRIGCPPEIAYFRLERVER